MLRQYETFLLDVLGEIPVKDKGERKQEQTGRDFRPQSKPDNCGRSEGREDWIERDSERERPGQADRESLRTDCPLEASQVEQESPRTSASARLSHWLEAAQEEQDPHVNITSAAEGAERSCQSQCSQQTIGSSEGRWSHHLIATTETIPMFPFV